MNIIEISKTQQQATITLDSNELITLANVLHEYEGSKNQTNEIFHLLYANLIMVKDITQYGSLDGWSLGRIIREREMAKNYGDHTDKS